MASQVCKYIEKYVSIKENKADKEIKSQWEGWQKELLDGVVSKDLSVVMYRQKTKWGEGGSLVKGVRSRRKLDRLGSWQGL